MPATVLPTAPTVLIIDDDRDLRDFLALLLQSEGYRVVEAASPARAREALTRHRPDVVVSEAYFPDTAPFTVLDLVASVAAGSRPRIVLCTSAIEDLASRERELAELGVGVVSKPFDIDNLLAAVGRAGTRTADVRPAIACSSAGEGAPP